MPVGKKVERLKKAANTDKQLLQAWIAVETNQLFHMVVKVHQAQLLHMKLIHGLFSFTFREIRGEC